MTDNAFTRRARRRKSSNSFTRRAAGKPKTKPKHERGTFEIPRVKTSQQLADSLAPSETPERFKWIKQGMKVHIVWDSDPALDANPTRKFTGKVLGIGEWAMLVSPSKEYLYIPLFTPGIRIEEIK